MRSLVVQTAFLGDVILTTPLLRHLARRGAVDVITTPAGAALLRGHPAVSRTIEFDKRGGDRGLAGIRRVAHLARASDGGDVAYLAQSSLRSAAIALIAGYRARVSFRSSAGRVLATKVVDPAPGTHYATRLLALADVPAPRHDECRPSLHPSPEDEQAVDRLLHAAGHRPEREPLIAVAPGSMWGTKRWPFYSELIRECADLGRLVIIGSAEDRPLARALAAASGAAAIDATGALGLLASAALIARCRILVTNDSAPLHMASAMNTPTIAIFGPTIPSMGFGPLADRAAVAETAGLDCRPCHSHGPQVCPRGHWRCMRDLGAAQIASQVRQVLGGATN